MEKLECISCRKMKANLVCEACEEAVCKSCSQFLDKNTFGFLEVVPEELTKTLYCSPCFDETVAPALNEYQEVLERAKSIFVFFTTQRKEIPLIKRSKISVSVCNLIDRDEAILRLGFLAAKQDYNAITEVEVLPTKVRNAGYQTSVWNGKGIPANVDADKMARQDRLNEIYR